LSGWKPKINQNYFFINNQNLVGYRIYLETNTDNYHYITGNMYPNEDIAMLALEYFNKDEVIKQNHLNQLKLIEIGGYVNG